MVMDIGNVMYLRMTRQLEETSRQRVVPEIDAAEKFEGTLTPTAKKREEDDAALVQFSSDREPPEVETYSRDGELISAADSSESLPAIDQKEQETLPAPAIISSAAPMPEKGSLLNLTA